jgi:hypothetical protein
VDSETLVLFINCSYSVYFCLLILLDKTFKYLALG